MFAAVVALAILAFILFMTYGPGPRLTTRITSPNVPDFNDLNELSSWLDQKEQAVPNLIDGAEAYIQFADPTAPTRTPLCFVYIHGFSATWPETAPVTERLAGHFNANVLQARLAGHGTGPETMVTPAERWCESMLETFEIARQLGDEIIIVATSTGATLSIWLASRAEARDHIGALLFMSPNFGIRNRVDFLLTAPLSRYWLPWIIGRERAWEPVNELQAKYWTYRYSTLALIEMQKTVDWVRRQDLATFHIPLATMYMKNDPTIDPKAATLAFHEWGARLDEKTLIEVSVDGDAPEHVFCGDIVGSHRTDWVVYRFREFLVDILG